MSWFKVDDAFHASLKVQSIPARQRFAAVGLWTLAGSWSSQQMTDGFVPGYMIRQWGATPKVVESLVNAGLWDHERDGFAFRSWAEYNPTKSQTEARRAVDAERKRIAREARAKKRAGDHAANTDRPSGHSEVSERMVSDPSALSRPVPTRPDPSRPEREVGVTEGGGSLRPQARDAESASPEVPPEWVGDPRRARCADHAGVASPPPCRACGDLRQDAERVRADRQATEQAAAADRRAERDACTLCDGSGMAPDGLSGLLRCPHDPQSLSDAQTAVQRDSEEHAEPEPDRAEPNPALQDWRHRWRNRTHVLHNETRLPAIEHDPNEPTS